MKQWTKTYDDGIDSKWLHLIAFNCTYFSTTTTTLNQLWKQMVAFSIVK